MVSSLNNQTAARDAGYEMVQYVGGRLTLTGAVNPSIKIGSIPAGSVIVAVVSRVVTVIAGGTPAAGIGVASGGNTLSGALAVAAGSSLTPPATTTGGPLAADTDIWLSATGGANAGDVIGGVLFIKPIA